MDIVKYRSSSIQKEKTRSDLLESSTNELNTLAEYIPNLADPDAKVLVLYMYYPKFKYWIVSKHCPRT